jgi:hypothetical protein
MAQLTKQALIVENNTSFPNNNTNYITPAILRSFNVDMIDSNVNQGVYNADSSSWNSKIANISSSALITASVNLNTITFTKGDLSTFNITVNTGSGGGGTTDITSLNAFTASQQTQNATLAPVTASLITSASSAAVSNSLDASKWVNISAQSGSWGLVSGSVPNGTVSSSAQIVGLGFLQTSSFQTYTSSVDSKFIAVGASTSSLNQFSASTAYSVLYLSQATQSLNASTQSLNTFTASAQISLNSLNSATASLFTSASLALVTASVNLNTITFTKGDKTTFAITVNTGSGGGGSTDISSLNAFTASQETKNTTLASVTSSLNTATASLFTSTSLSLYTASISGQLLSFTKGNNTQFTLTIPTGSGTYVTGSYGSFQDTTTQSGSADIAYKMKFNTTDTSDGVILSGSTGLKVAAYGIYDLQWSGQLAQGNGASQTSIWVSVNGVYVSGSRGDVSLAADKVLLPSWNYFLTLNPLDVVELWWSSTNNNTTWVSEPAGVSPTRPSVASIIATLSRVDVGGGSNSVSNATFNAYTSSINAYTESNDTKWNNLQATTQSFSASVASISALTGSYATTGSNSFNGSQIITGSLTSSADIRVNSMTIGLGGGNIAANLAIGSASLQSNTTGGGNVAIGNATLQSNVGGASSVAIGSSALRFFSTAGAANNIAIGGNTLLLLGVSGSAIAAIQQNTIVGGSTGQGLTVGARNTIVGALAFQGADYVSRLTGIGRGVFGAIGSAAPTNGSGSQYNTAIGHNAAFSLQSGSNNVIIHGGSPSGEGWTLGSNNNIIGMDSGLPSTLEASTIIGRGITGLTSPVSNAVILADGQGNVLLKRPSLNATTQISSSLDISGSLTMTGSLNVTGSNTLIGTKTVTGSVFISGSKTIIGTNTVTGSMITTGSFILTGSAYGNVVSMSITSNTASMDLTKGNYFELTSSASPLRIELSNIKAGLTSTLIISASVSTSIAFSTNVGQPSPGAYSGSAAASTDILSFVAFNTTKANLVATKNII